MGAYGPLGPLPYPIKRYLPGIMAVYETTTLHVQHMFNKLYNSVACETRCLTEAACNVRFVLICSLNEEAEVEE